MKQKHFIDIQNIREEDTELRENNVRGFVPGDIIQITEKYDGSNACCCWDSEEGCMKAFSRKQELNFSNNLNGFWNYVQGFSQEVVNYFTAFPEYRVFGEWSNKNKIVYNDTGKVKHWYVYDIFDTESGRWLSQDIVKKFCSEVDLEYIHELYYGAFVSWEHCKSFMNSSAYGDTSEGIVVKNQTKLESADDTKYPTYIKIVNDSFKERMKTKEKIIDPEKENAKAEAQRIMESIVTQNRIAKELFKMRDEGIIPEKIEPKDFGLIARHLPKRIFEDIMKEEKELVMACGEYGGKACSSITMQIFRNMYTQN